MEHRDKQWRSGLCYNIVDSKVADILMHIFWAVVDQSPLQLLFKSPNQQPTNLKEPPVTFAGLDGVITKHSRRAAQSRHLKDKAKQNKAKQSKTKQNKAKQSKTKQNNPLPSQLHYGVGCPAHHLQRLLSAAPSSGAGKDAHSVGRWINSRAEINK